MSNPPTAGRSAAYRIPGVVALALLGGGGIYAAHRAEQDFHEQSELSLAAPKRTLLLLSHDADVEISTGTGKRIHIVRRAHWVGSKPSHSVHVATGSSERVELADGCPGGVRSAAALFSFHSACGVSYRISVPAGQTLVLSGAAGDVDLRDLSGNVTALVRSGDVDASGMRATNVHLTSQSGDVAASFLQAPVSLDSGSDSGDVSLRVPAGGYRLKVTTESGDRSIEGIANDPASTHAIAAATSSGDVSVGRSDR
jgi:hypothetical protein